MRLTGQLEVRQRPGRSIHQRDRVHHLRHARPLAHTATIQEHHQRNTPQPVVVPILDHPPALMPLQAHRGVRQVQHRIRRRTRRIILRRHHPHRSPQTTMTMVNVHRQLARILHLNQRKLRVLLIRTNRHEPAPQNQHLLMVSD